jgi:hypothetical protein
VGKAADWLREERRKTLGDWVAFCLACGFVQRYFDESEGELPKTCPGAALRPAEAFGVPIRRVSRRTKSGSPRSESP